MARRNRSGGLAGGLGSSRAGPKRAPAGGVWIGGVFYPGGVFLPGAATVQTQRYRVEFSYPREGTFFRTYKITTVAGAGSDVIQAILDRIIAEWRRRYAQDITVLPW